MPKLKDYFNVSLEDSQIEEIEYIFFIKVDNFDELLKFAKRKEEQEQWSFLLTKDKLENAVRARKKISDGEISYELCSKIYIPGIDGKWEVEQDCERMHFDIVKENAEFGMIKDRYYFPIDGTDMVWELDVFKDKDGNYVPWIKVDLEVEQRLDKIPEMPIHYVECVMNQPGQRTKEEDELVSKLFGEYYLIKVGN